MISRAERRFTFSKDGKDADLELIEQTFYDNVKPYVTRISVANNLIRDLEAEISSGNYTEKAVKALREKIDAAQHERREAAKEAGSYVKDLVRRFQEYKAAQDILDPDKVDDKAMKLLQSGYADERDIQAILDRDPDNKTMYNIVYRYAKDRGMDTRGFKSKFAEEARETEGRAVKISDFWNAIERNHITRTDIRGVFESWTDKIYNGSDDPIVITESVEASAE